jgi:AraC-like DNA-binding protein
MPATYREMRAAHPEIACGWVSGGAATNVLPDACVDIVATGERLGGAGPAPGGGRVPATPGLERAGVRFRVGAAGPALGIDADQLLDRTVDLEELWGAEARRLRNRVLGAPTILAGLAALYDGVAHRVPAHDPQVRTAVQTLRRDPAVPAHALARQVALSERQLQRRFARAVGYGPRTLSRTLRFQEFLRQAAADPAAPLARLAADAGYADQAHLTRESRRLSGRTPAQLREHGARPAGEPPSEPFKPVALASGTMPA